MSIKVSRILHAGYIFEHAGTRIAFDTIFENPFSKNCYAYPPIRFDLEGIRRERFDAVFISHYHDDHCSLESLNLLDRATPIHLFCVHEELFELIRQLGFTNVNALELNRQVQVGEISVIPHRSLDADVDSLFEIRAGEFKILNVVDSWIDEEVFVHLLKVPWDLVLWPFQTMREVEVISPRFARQRPPGLPAEWLQQISALSPKILVPSSCQFIQETWSWYNRAFFPISYRSFALEMARIVPQTKILRLDPGVSVSLLTEGRVAFAAPVPWIEPVGSQDVDYEYDENFPVPPTGEIAKHFSDIGQGKTDLIYSYCEYGLLERYRDLGTPEGRYFRKKRHWRLAVYDFKGDARVFNYRLDDESIELCDFAGEPEWTTDIPLEKFYAALIDGETLTSLYLRVNDGPFDERTDRALQDVEMIDDPLVRCLYNGVVGAYQRAQLRRLTAD